MSSPDFLELLNADYANRLAQAKIFNTTPEEDAAPRGVGGLKIIVDANDLFRQITPQLASSEFYLLMVNGQQGSGKSTIARELAHKAHGLGYDLMYSSGFDIIDAPTKFVDQAKALGSTKICVVLDDLSYVMSATSAKTQSKIKSFFALIRHALQAKVFIIVISHFTTAVPPIFKNSNVWIFSKPTTQEYDGMIKIVGRRETQRAKLETMFQSVNRLQEEANKNPEVHFKMDGKPYVFRWGSKEDPGDGRLMLAIFDGEPQIYNSKNVSCPQCVGIGFGVKVRTEDYKSKRPSEEDEEDDKD